LCLLFPLLLKAQQSQNIVDFYQAEMMRYKAQTEQPAHLTNDTLIDIHFYQLHLNPAIDSAYLEASATIGMKSKAEGLQSFLLDLHQSLFVDSIIGASGFEQRNDSLIIFLVEPASYDELLSFTIYYSGLLELAGGIKGMRYETHKGLIPVIATLSTPYLAHYWYPCKDGPADKADSVYVDITLPNIAYDGYPLIGVSNGILEETTTTDTSNTFHWRHRHAIVPYYVMMAVSNFVHLGHQYCNSDACFPLDYYVFAADSTSAEAGTADIPEAMALFETLFGPYPYADEKYGMTQLGYYGAIENQTNTIINNMSPAWFMISVHELAHMWFGCRLSCVSWHHGWLNEGFATYAEALWKEHKEGLEAYRAHMMSKAWYQGGTVYLEDVDDPFGIFLPIIYNKGAWVLHMLRYVLGDEVFFAALRNYNSAFPEGQVSTSQFRAYFETATNFGLETFIDQWVYDAYYPIYYYNFEQSGEIFGIQIYQAQGETGKRELFEMPLEILLEFEDGTDSIVKVQNNLQNQHFEFTLSHTVISILPDPNQWVLHGAMYVPELPVGFMKKEEEAVFSIYPNPASSRVFIAIRNKSIEKYLCRLSNLQGMVLLEKTMHSNSLLLDLTSINAGVYLLDIYDANDMVVGQKKLVVY
jgi:aminopeptidase N